MASNFNISGLASGIDWSTMIDQLMTLASTPLKQVLARQTAIKTQVSLLGELSSKLASLQQAAQKLAGEGLVAVKATSSTQGFTVTPGPGAVEGRFEVQVLGLATAAKARSAAFESRLSAVPEGTLELTVMGETYTVTLAPGGTLQDAANALNAAGAPIVASLLSDGTSTYLTLTNRVTGHPIGAPEDGLRIFEKDGSGAPASLLGLAIIQAPSNATFTIDGLSFERTSNLLADVIDGVTLTLTAPTATPETLALDVDATATAERIKTFVSAYNDLASLVQKQLAVGASTNRSTTLAGDNAVRQLQSELQALLVAAVGEGGVATLADLGLKTGRDGTISLDETALASALTRDPVGADRLFASTEAGIAALVDDLVERFTDPTDGLLAQRTRSLNGQVTALDDEAARIEMRLEKTRENLVRQFTALETTMGELKTIEQFLEMQTKSWGNKGK